jgi:RNA polymerase sigma-70 factor (ECF subfamily)
MAVRRTKRRRRQKPAGEQLELVFPLPVLDRYARNMIGWRASQLCRRAPFIPSDSPDIEQELALDLMQRASRWNPTKGTWRGFVWRVVQNHMSSLLKNARSQRRGQQYATFSLHRLERVPEEGCDGHELTQEVADTERPLTRPSSTELRIDLFVAIDRLPEDLRVVCLRLQEESVHDIARSLGCSRKAIYRRLTKASALLAEAGLRDYLPNNHRGDIQ